MPTNQEKEALLQEVDSVVQDACAWFEGPGLTSQARVEEWGAWEVLAHFLYWHNLTAESVKSVAEGGPPLGLPAPLDETNSIAIARQAGKTIPDLVAELRNIHSQYVQEVQSFDNLDVPIRIRPNGTHATVLHQLQQNSNHIRGHMQQLREAESTNL